jgi:hypothetical protein
VASHPAGGRLRAAAGLGDPDPDPIGSALFGVAATALGLLFIGIHNSWDTVTYVVTEAGRRRQGKKK